MRKPGIGMPCGDGQPGGTGPGRGICCARAPAGEGDVAKNAGATGTCGGGRNTGTVWTGGGKAKACGKAMLVQIEDEWRAGKSSLINAINTADPNDVRNMRSGRADIARPASGRRWRKNRIKSVHQAASSVLLVECALREVERESASSRARQRFILKSEDSQPGRGAAMACRRPDPVCHYFQCLRDSPLRAGASCAWNRTRALSSRVPRSYFLTSAPGSCALINDDTETREYLY